MRYLILLVLFSSCASSSGSSYRKMTTGEEICAVACKRIGGEFHNMTEHPRKCYCVYDMPEFSLQQEQEKPKAPGTVYAY